MTIAEALAFGITRLSNLEDPRLETEILLAHALKIKHSTLITDQLRAIEPLRQTLFEQFIARRLKYEPTAYIVGYQPFLGLDFKVDKRVLIPRPETELLVENALSLISHSSLDICHFSVVDVGTGSGCIAITLAKKLPTAKVIAIDLSVNALALAKENAITHGVNVSFLEGDLLSPLKEKVDLIVSNPPYIPTADLAGLDPDVKDWEPVGALDGGNDGLDYIRRLIKDAPAHLNPGGKLMFEFGFGQAATIRQLFSINPNYKDIIIINDYAGIPRICSATALGNNIA